jgi:hypothetical protein
LDDSCQSGTFGSVLFPCLIAAFAIDVSNSILYLVVAELVFVGRRCKIKVMEMRINEPFNEGGVSALNEILVADLKDRGHIVTAQVEAAFRAVPHHLFVPVVSLEEAYT